MSFSVAFVGVLGEAQGYAATVQERPVDRPAVPPSDIVDDAMAAEMADYYGWPIDQAEERVAEQNAIVDFKASLPQSVREAWAGGVVDQEGGGGRRWFVATTEAKAELEDAAQSLALSGDTSLSVELVDHSLQDLEAAALDVAMSLSEAGAVVTQISVEVEDNGLAVGVPASDAVLEAQLTSPIAPDSAVESASQNRQTVEATILEAAQVNGVSIEVSEAREPRLDVEMSCTPGPYVFNVATTLHCDDPLRGGPAIFRNSPFGGSGGICSGGFQVRSELAGHALYLLTAGHCAEPGAENGTLGRGIPYDAYMPKTSYARHNVGTWWRSVYNPTNGDGGLIAVDNVTGWAAGWPIVYVHPSQSSGKDTTFNELYVIHDIGVWDNLDTNDWLCKTGGVSWTDCGRYDGSEANSQVGVIRYFVSMLSCHGDSGGPVLGSSRGWGMVYSGRHSAPSIHWYSLGGPEGTSTCAPDTLVMALARPMDALNVYLVTQANP